MAIGLAFAASCQSRFRERERQSCLSAVNAGWIRACFDSRRSNDTSNLSFKCRDPLFGTAESQWLSLAHDLPVSAVRFAADDDSDLTPDDPKFLGPHGYHPLEELKKHERKIHMLLTDAEIARTTVEANSRAVLVFPGNVHSEPHRHASWAEYQYVINDYGDIFFEIPDDESILEFGLARSPVTVLIGMDTSLCGDNRMASGGYSDSQGNTNTDIDDDYEMVPSTEAIDLIRWGMPKTMRHVHPIYFSKYLVKSAMQSLQEKNIRRMESPSNGVSIVGILKPVSIDEESHLWKLFDHENGDGYSSDWNDDENLRYADQRHVTSMLYKLHIKSVEVFSIYGVQSKVSLQHFEDAEPDSLAYSASALVEHFNHARYRSGLKSLCRKKIGLFKTANIIGVDSLGIDVRVSFGLQLQTLRFSFDSRAWSKSVAEWKIKRMLFPRYQRKSSKPETEPSS